MTAISLSDAQHEKMVKEFFAKKSARQLLSKEETVAIAQRLNEKVSLPFLSETKEHLVLLKIVLKVDNYFYETLPNEIYHLIYDLDEGFDESEAAQLAARLNKLAHEEIKLPFLTDHQEYYSVAFVLSLLINAMREGSDLEHSISVTKHPRMMEDDFPFPEIL